MFVSWKSYQHKANELIPNLQCTMKKTVLSIENHLKKLNEFSKISIWFHAQPNSKPIYIVLKMQHSLKTPSLFRLSLFLALIWYYLNTQAYMATKVFREGNSVHVVGSSQGPLKQLGKSFLQLYLLVVLKWTGKIVIVISM